MLVLLQAGDTFDGKFCRNPGLGSTKGRDKAPSQHVNRHHPYRPPQLSKGSNKGGDDSEDDGGVAKGKSRRRGVTKGSDRYLACPCFKFNPIRYEACLHKHLTSTSFVVQHLERSHGPQPIHCPLCGREFDTCGARDNHIRQTSCERQNFRHVGLSEDQRHRLRDNRRHLNEVERWYCIWDIMYPDTPRPDSPYVGGAIEEIVGIIRRAYRTARENFFGGSSLRDFFADFQESRGVSQPYSSDELDHIQANSESLLLDWSRVQSIIPHRDDLSFLTSDSRAGFHIEFHINPSAFPSRGIGSAGADSNQHQSQSSQPPDNRQQPRHGQLSQQEQSHLEPSETFPGNNSAANTSAAGHGSDISASQLLPNYIATSYSEESFFSQAVSASFINSATTQETNMTSPLVDEDRLFASTATNSRNRGLPERYGRNGHDGNARNNSQPSDET